MFPYNFSGFWAIQHDYAVKMHRLANARLRMGKEALPIMQASKAMPMLALLDPPTLNYWNDYSKSLGNYSGVAIVSIEGTMSRNGMCGSLGNEAIAQILKANDRDPAVKAHILKMNTPGGTVDSTKLLADTVGGLKKPCYAQGNLIASGGVFATAMCKGIYLEDQLGKAFGSIGVLSVYVDDSEAEAMAGIKTQVVLADGSEDKWREFSLPMPAEMEAEIKAELNAIRTQFVGHVRRGRAGKLTSDSVFSGKMYTNKEAVAFGLVDGIASLDEVIKMALAS